MNNINNNIPDNELVIKAKSGDIQAFNQLHDRYKTKIFNFLLHVVGNRAQAEELTQETFLRVFERLDEYTEEGKFSSWLFTIAVNFGRKRLRRRKLEPFSASQKPSSDEDDKSIEIFERISDETARPDVLAQQKELQKRIRECINKLPQKHKDVLVLCDIQGHSYAEAAEILKLNPNSIGIYLQRARAKFQKIIKIDDFDIKFIFSYDWIKDFMNEKILHYISCIFKLSAYLDNELPKIQMDNMQRHVSTCSKCHALIPGFEKTKVILNLIRPVSLSSSYDASFQERLVDLTAQLRAKQGALTVSENISRQVDRFLESLDEWSAQIWVPVPVRVSVTAASLVILIAITVANLDTMLPGPQFYAKGQVEWFDEKSKDWDDLDSHKQFKDNSQIRVADNSHSNFSVKDIYGIQLRENSEILIDDIIRTDEDTRTQMQLKSGSLIVKLGDEFKGKEFILEIADLTIVAKGTAYLAQILESGQILIELVSGDLFIQTPDESFTLAENEYFALQEDGVINIEALDIVRIEQIYKELSAIPPYIDLSVTRINYLEVELALTKTEDRAKEFFYPFSIKLLKNDRRLLAPFIDRISKNLTDNTPYATVEPLLSILLSDYRDEEFTAPIALFLASYCLHNRDYENTLKILTSVVHLNNQEWSSLAQCAIGIIYDDLLGRDNEAKEAFNKILQFHGSSLEVQEAMNRLGK